MGKVIAFLLFFYALVAIGGGVLLAVRGLVWLALALCVVMAAAGVVTAFKSKKRG